MLKSKQWPLLLCAFALERKGIGVKSIIGMSLVGKIICSLILIDCSMLTHRLFNAHTVVLVNVCEYYVSCNNKVLVLSLIWQPELSE